MSWTTCGDDAFKGITLAYWKSHVANKVEGRYKMNEKDFECTITYGSNGFIVKYLEDLLDENRTHRNVYHLSQSNEESEDDTDALIEALRFVADYFGCGNIEIKKRESND